MRTTMETQNLAKKAYTRPTLVTYGDLRKLTQSGSGSKNESTNPKFLPFKHCVPDATKKC